MQMTNEGNMTSEDGEVTFQQWISDTTSEPEDDEDWCGEMQTEEEDDEEDEWEDDDDT